jgi:superfamily II DNA or RNA helicase
MSKLTYRGYVIQKSSLSTEQLAALKFDLAIAPKENHVVKLAAKKSNINANLIIVYRENEQKLYIPRFYGIRHFGEPGLSELSPGLDIDVSFTQTLRDYQEKIIDVYMSHVTSGRSGGRSSGGGGILEVPCGAGKTIMALNICSRLMKKTLILVHKEFLMNQWIDRIRDFLPSARVGKIQGKTFDIENKDIVIGMIQTMYDRPYPPNTFASFGLTISDEVHRVGSEEFSKTLLKVVTPYMLGISATVDRKDGLTELLYMFIGPKIYSETRKDDDGVQVRAIQFDHSDEKRYREEQRDVRGNIKYSTMINQISDFGPRRIFLMRVLQDLIKENSEKQIMVLSHKRDLLDYLETEIGSSFATVGQYVGGMKAAALQESEGKQIVLATYAMAAEALDIKSLNTLVMVSPKTDIIQSVGRILRTRSDGKIIVDIVDSHEVFQNQWKKRRAYYKKSNYGIKMIKSKDYVDMLMAENSLWTTVYDRNKHGVVEEPKSTCQLDL